MHDVLELGATEIEGNWYDTVKGPILMHNG